MHDSPVQRGTEPTYLRVKNHLVTKFGQAEFASHKAEVQARLKSSSRA
jgi:hypothetical protein